MSSQKNNDSGHKHGFFSSNSPFFSRPHFNSKYMDDDDSSSTSDAAAPVRSSSPFNGTHKDDSDYATSPTNSRNQSVAVGGPDDAADRTRKTSQNGNSPSVAAPPDYPPGPAALHKSALKALFSGSSSRRSSFARRSSTASSYTTSRRPSTASMSNSQMSSHSHHPSRLDNASRDSVGGSNMGNTQVPVPVPKPNESSSPASPVDSPEKLLEPEGSRSGRKRSDNSNGSSEDPLTERADPDEGKQPVIKTTVPDAQARSSPVPVPVPVPSPSVNRAPYAPLPSSSSSSSLHVSPSSPQPLRVQRQSRRHTLFNRLIPRRNSERNIRASTTSIAVPQTSAAARTSISRQAELRTPVKAQFEIGSVSNSPSSPPVSPNQSRKVSSGQSVLTGMTPTAAETRASINSGAMFGIDLADDTDMSEITKLSTSAAAARNSSVSTTGGAGIGGFTAGSFAGSPSASGLGSASPKPSWAAPESWKVKPDSVPNLQESASKKSSLGRTYSALSASSSSCSSESSSLDLRENSASGPDAAGSGTSTTGASTPALNVTPTGTASSSGRGSISIEHERRRHSHKNELKGAARSAVRFFKGEKSSVIPCTRDTTCKDVLDVLLRKRFLKSDEDHIMVLKCGGLTRSVGFEERPLRIQRNLLYVYGYTERDNLDYIERTDLSFLFQFIVQDRGVETISEDKRTRIDPQNVNLVNWNLKDIPNFLYAEPIVSLDVSQNPSFEFTDEFMHDCRNLKSLKFTRSGNPVFPTPVTCAPRLQQLNLQVNYIRVIPPEIAQLKHLTTLNIACNRISKLPESFTQLENLQELNISSNRLKRVPEQLFSIKELRKLDFSYNSISEIPEKMSSLEQLEVLQIAANKLTGNFPDFFKDFANLIKVDVRFNNLSSLDSLKESPKLEVIRATGNNISVFKSNCPSLFEVEMNLNPLTYVYFEVPMERLKLVDFSKGKLTSCAFVKMLVAAEELVLDHNHLSGLPDEISYMKKLTKLSAFKNNLNALPNSIAELKKLRYLDVHLNNISLLNDAIWKLDSLEEFNISSNLLDTFPDPPKITKQAHLTDENHNESRDHSPTSLKDLEFPIEHSLKILSMSDNNLTDAVIHSLAPFHNLEILNLSYNEIFDITPGYMSNMYHLRSLFLSGNYLSSLPIEDFDSFGEMKHLLLNGNRFHTLPAELGKINNLVTLDVGSNSLKYNIGNIPYDWNWCYNKKLRWLNFSGNKRLEIKPQHKRDDIPDRLDSFSGLKDLVVLGLMDVTITTDAVPDQSVDLRVRSTSSQLGKFGYGISDTLGTRSILSTRDVVTEKFRGNADEMLITIYDGKNSSSKHGDKVSKIMQETFGLHLKKELETLNNVITPATGVKTVEDCLREAFLLMNSEMNILINKDKSSTFSSAAAHRTTTTDELTLDDDGLRGCCATVIYIKGSEVYLANIGDSMGVLTQSDGGYKIITTKHEPYAPGEYDRIRQSGGYVTTDGNLDGVSDVSRAVGYFKLIPHITAQPSVQKFKLTPNEEMIAIATSDIWKKVPYDLAADIIRQEKSNPGVAAEKLRDFAISYGSSDKSTAVVLSLKQFTSKTKHHERSSQPEDSTLRKLDEEIEPPTGEVAMAFTDIKNSTLLWDTYPVAMRSAIKVHNSIMRRQLRIIGGYEVKTEGDAFMVSFPTVTSSLLWCFTLQNQLVQTDEWPAEILQSDQGCEIRDADGNIIYRGLSVRMGVHLGTPVCERDIVTRRMDYFGPMVNRASRVSSVADGGQITMSFDFYTEFHKVIDNHAKIQAGELKIEDAYPSKAEGEVIEAQMAQLEQIGWVEKSIGSKKLKGLETPEKIWLIYPKPLAARLQMLDTNGAVQKKTNNLTRGGVTSANVWALRTVALRLERVCNFLASTDEGHITADANTVENFYDSVAGRTGNSATRTENFTNVLLEHTITRIENCILTLSVRRQLGGMTLQRSTTEEVYSGVADLLAEIQHLKAALQQASGGTGGTGSAGAGGASFGTAQVEEIAQP